MSIKDYQKCRFCQWKNGRKGNPVHYNNTWDDRDMLVAVFVGAVIGVVIGIFI